MSNNSSTNGSQSVLRQPKSFYLIFFVELWERYGYYGVQSTLVLFMVNFLGYADKPSEELLAGFSALVYLLPAVGGYIGDNILGTRRTIVLGAAILVVGYALFAFSAVDNNILFPLAVIAVGNGMFKANPSSLLSKIYAKNKSNPDSGFTLYYMAVNIGSFLTIAITPYLAHKYGWALAFGTSAIGLIIALSGFITLMKWVKEYGSEPDQNPILLERVIAVIISAILLIFLSYYLLRNLEQLTSLLVDGVVILFMFYFYHMFYATKEELKGMFMFLILFAQAVVFFVLYFQMPTSLTLFAARNVEHSLLGIHIEPASFQAFNAFWIIVLSPILAVVYQYLANRNRDPSMPFKFALGMLFAGLSFAILPFAARYAHNGVISGWWLVLSYGFQSTGELLVSALGLAVVTRYIPQRIMGFVMGLWFLCASIAALLAARVAGYASISKELSSDPVASLPVYTNLFLHIGEVTLIIGVIFLILVPLVKKIDKPLITNGHSDSLNE